MLADITGHTGAPPAGHNATDPSPPDPGCDEAPPWPLGHAAALLQQEAQALAQEAPPPGPTVAWPHSCLAAFI